MRYVMISSFAFCLVAMAGGFPVSAVDNVPVNGRTRVGGNQQEKKEETSGEEKNAACKDGSGKSIARWDPVVRQIEGWTVYVDPALIDGKHSAVGARALAMLDDHLRRIGLLVTGEQLKKIKQLEIWIEHHHPEVGAMQYHPNADWLKKRGYDPRLAKKVHITRRRRYCHATK